MAIEDRDGLGWMDGENLKGMHLQGLYKSSMGNGVLAGTVLSTALKITEDEAAADFTVTAQLGNCRINGTIYPEAADIEDIAVTAAHATDERIDLVIYDQSGSTVAIVDGTPHATDPQIPDVTDDDDLPLAYIYVVPVNDGGYTGTIVNGDIHDLRAFIPTGTKYIYMPVTSMLESIADTAKTFFGYGTTTCSGVELGVADADSDLYLCSFIVPEDMVTESAVELWFSAGSDADNSGNAVRLDVGVAAITVAGAAGQADDTFYNETIALTKLDGASIVAQIQYSADISAALARGEVIAFSWLRDGDHVDDTLDVGAGTHFSIIGWHLKYTGILG